MTVLLETAWVLRSSYGFSRDEIVAALRSIAGLRRVRLEDPASARRALDWMAAGMDFADAMHLAGASDCDAFVSFDRRLAARARQLGTVPVRAP